MVWFYSSGLERRSCETRLSEEYQLRSRSLGRVTSSGSQIYGS